MNSKFKTFNLYDNIIFDFDGVLYKDGINVLKNALSKVLGRDIKISTILRCFNKGYCFNKMLKYIIRGKQTKSLKEITILTRNYVINDINKTDFNEPILIFMNSIKRENNKISIISNNDYYVIEAFLKKNRIFSFFHKIIANHCPNGYWEAKPSAKSYNLNFDSELNESTIYVGDTLTDEEFAKNSNIRFIKILYSEIINYSLYYMFKHL